MDRTTNRTGLHELLAAHFTTTAIEQLVVTRREFPHWMRPDLQRALEALFAPMPEHRFAGARLRDRSLDFRFADLGEAGDGAIAAGPAVYQDVDIGEEWPVRCLTRGLWLAERDGVPFALLLDTNEGYRGVGVRLEIGVPPGDAPGRLATRLAAELSAGAERGACWRGKVLILDQAHDEFEVAAVGLRVMDAAPVGRDEIILPAATLPLIERNTVGFARQAQQLARLGMSTKKGVLLYGPPGTGKTLVARWLTGELEGFTKLIITAERYTLLPEALAMARALQPSLVVLEDVDLIGAHRDGPWAAGGMLNTLLNGMDGLAAEACVLFVLTTNRPEVLEPALAARPGRIDQAIEIGLPGEVERRLLVKRYARRLGISEELAAETAKRAGRVSPAFIKELMRRAAQAMFERGGTEVLELHDVERALEDMLGAGGRRSSHMPGAERAIGFTALA